MLIDEIKNTELQYIAKTIDSKYEGVGQKNGQLDLSELNVFLTNALNSCSVETNVNRMDDITQIVNEFEFDGKDEKLAQNLKRLEELRKLIIEYNEVSDKWHETSEENRAMPNGTTKKRNWSILGPLAFVTSAVAFVLLRKLELPVAANLFLSLIFGSMPGLCIGKEIEQKTNLFRSPEQIQQKKQYDMRCATIEQFKDEYHNLRGQILKKVLEIKA